jgi:hypothetical protein
MTTNNSTATTHKELAAQFPYTDRPFAVWYNPDPKADHRKWAVTGESGIGIGDFADLVEALKTAAEMGGKEWYDEARFQAQTLANLMSETKTVSIGHEVLIVRAQLRAALAMLHSAEGYGEASPDGEKMCDASLALRDADEKLNEIHERIDAAGLA